jgi:hypothetical protein
MPVAIPSVQDNIGCDELECIAIWFPPMSWQSENHRRCLIHTEYRPRGVLRRSADGLDVAG